MLELLRSAADAKLASGEDDPKANARNIPLVASGPHLLSFSPVTLAAPPASSSCPRRNTPLSQREKGGCAAKLADHVGLVAWRANGPRTRFPRKAAMRRAGPPPVRNPLLMLATINSNVATINPSNLQLELKS